jgi:ADP-heptose:LPS heptosyltransferase
MLSPKILLIRHGAMGDVIWTTPIVRQIWRDHGGDCLIDVLTLKSEVFAGSPWVNAVLTPENFDSRQKLYDKTINLDLAYEKYPSMHLLAAYAKFSHGSIDGISAREPQLFESQQDQLGIEQRIDTEIDSQFLVLHMRRDTWPSRNLSTNKWRAIVDELLLTSNLKIVQVGSLNEICFNHDPRLINLMGQLSLQQLKVLIASAKVYVGIDSGTLHVAACTATPIVALFTSCHHTYREPLGRDKTDFYPIPADIECYGCQSRMPPPVTGVVCARGDVACIESFVPEKIGRAIRAYL